MFNNHTVCFLLLHLPHKATTFNLELTACNDCITATFWPSNRLQFYYTNTFYWRLLQCVFFSNRWRWTIPVFFFSASICSCVFVNLSIQQIWMAPPQTLQCRKAFGRKKLQDTRESSQILSYVSAVSVHFEMAGQTVHDFHKLKLVLVDSPTHSWTAWPATGRIAPPTSCDHERFSRRSWR